MATIQTTKFLNHLVTDYLIFQNDDEIEHVDGNNIIESNLLIESFTIPGRNKLEAIAKHVLQNFVVHRGNEKMEREQAKDIVSKFKEANKLAKPDAKNVEKTKKSKQRKQDVETCFTVNISMDGEHVFKMALTRGKHTKVISMTTVDEGSVKEVKDFIFGHLVENKDIIKGTQKGEKKAKRQTKNKPVNTTDLKDDIDTDNEESNAVVSVQKPIVEAPEPMSLESLGPKQFGSEVTIDADLELDIDEWLNKL